MPQPNWSRSTWPLLLVCLLLCPIASAMSPPDEEPPAEGADETTPTAGAESTVQPLVVTATRSEKPVHETPATVYELDLEDLTNDRIIRTIPEAFREIPGVLVQKTGHAQGSPFLRGFTSFRNLFLIDGIRLNNAVFREGPNQYWGTVDPFGLSSLEIQKGTASVLYGSDAIGGAVQAFSQEAFRNEGNDLQWRGRLYDRFSTAEHSNILRAELDAGARSTGLHLGVTWKEFGDLESGDGELPETGYGEFDLDAKITHWLAPDARLLLGYQRVDQTPAPRTHRTVHAVPFAGSSVGSELQRDLEQERDLLFGQFHATDRGGVFDEIHASLSWHRQAEEQDRIRGDMRRDVQGFDVDSLGASLQLGTPTPIGDFTYGVEYYHDDVSSFRRDYNADGTLRRTRIQGPVGDDAGYDLLGLYVQDDLDLGFLELIGGLRFTHVEADAKHVEDPDTGLEISLEEDYQNLSASGSALLRIDQLLGQETDHFNLFGSVAQGFRAPNLSDLSRLDTARSGELEIPTTGGLEPEKFITFEVGAKTNFDWWEAQLAYFYTDIDNQIIRAPTGAMIGSELVVEKRNAGQGFVEGVELETRFFLGDFTLRGGFAWIDGELEEFPTSDPVPAVNDLTRLHPTWGLLSLRYDHPEDVFWGEALVTFTDEQTQLSAGDMRDTTRIPPGGTPGHTIFSLRGGWQITEDIDFTAALENVTDQNYRIHGSGLNEPGINLILGLDIQFGNRPKDDR